MCQEVFEPTGYQHKPSSVRGYDHFWGAFSCEHYCNLNETDIDVNELLQNPGKVPMGVPAVAGTISAGLLIGAGISKNIASFLEENELFGKIFNVVFITYKF